MNTILSIQIKRLFSTIVKLYVPTLLLLLFVILINYQTDIDLGIFTRDPAVIAGANGLTSKVNLTTNPLVGVVSNIGILCWCICASNCFFSSAILRSRRNSETSKVRIFANFFYFFGIITTFFLLDDLFLFHEIIAPELFNISEKAVYYSYVFLLAWGVVKYRKIIFETDWYLFCLAFLFFGFSVLIDKFFDYLYLFKFAEEGGWLGLLILLEDGFKLFGIVSWLGYFTRVCFQVMKDAFKFKTDYCATKENLFVTNNRQGNG